MVALRQFVLSGFYLRYKIVAVVKVLLIHITFLEPCFWYKSILAVVIPQVGYCFNDCLQYNF